jgi:transcriptional regulator with XRE-family HTH domain
MAADEAREKATRKTNEVGPTGQAVARNLVSLREVRGLSTYDLSKLLAAAGRPIAPSAISRIESRARKVDVDDLMALAVALRVSPVALLLPPTADPNSDIEITGHGSVSADLAWSWALAEQPLDLPADDDGAVWNDFQTTSRAPGLRKYRATKEPDPSHKVTEELSARISRNRGRTPGVQRGVGGRPRQVPPEPPEAEG